jgi:hypothetical protein
MSAASNSPLLPKGTQTKAVVASHAISEASSLPELCQCVESCLVDFQVVPALSWRRGKRFPVICVCDMKLAKHLIDQCGVRAISSDPYAVSQWSMFCNSNRASLQFYRTKQQSYLVRGDPLHQLCTLVWLEAALGSGFCWKVERLAGRFIPHYHATSESEAPEFPPPLYDRLSDIAALMRRFQSPTKPEKRQTGLASPWKSQRMGLEEKQLILQAYSQVETGSDEENPSQEEEESISEEIWPPSGYENAFVCTERLDTAKGYTVRYSPELPNDLKRWMMMESGDGLQVMHHSYHAQGGVHLLKLHPNAESMMNDSSAGCGSTCQLSEAASFDLLSLLVESPFELCESEMGIRYDVLNAPLLH